MYKKKHILVIENFTTISKETIDLSPGILGIVGPNAAGKSNFLKSLTYLVSGKNDPALIQHGAEKASLRLEVIEVDEDGNKSVTAVITRTQTKKNTSLKSTGLNDTTPKKYLSSIMDSQMLNPVRLITHDAVKYLKEHLSPQFQDGDIPEGFVKLEAEISEDNPFSFCERATDYLDVTRGNCYKNKRHQQEVLVDLKEGVPEKVTELGFTEEEVQEQLGEINRKMGEVEQKAKEDGKRKQKFESITEEIMDKDLEIDSLSIQISKFDEKIKHLKSKIRTETEVLKIREKDQKCLAEEIRNNLPPKIDELKAQKQRLIEKTETISNHRLLIQRVGRVERQEKKVSETKEFYDLLDGLFKHFAYELPKTLISRCKLPVKGIEFRDGNLFIDDMRFDLLSEAEQALNASKIVTALAVEKGHLVASLDGIEVMDEKHRDLLLESVKDQPIKFIYTRMGEVENEFEFLSVGGKLQKKGDKKCN